MWLRPQIEHGIPTKFGYTVYYPLNLVLGENIDIGWGTFIQAAAGVIIEDNVQIGGGCYIYSNNTIDGYKGVVHISEGARIGACTVILPNVKIGKNALIGAQSLIKKDVPENEKVIGVWA